MGEINEWVEEFGVRTKTKWITRKSCPNGERFVCWKKFVCHHSSFKKVPAEQNNRGISKNAECLASIHVKIKLNNMSTKMYDDFIRQGLAAVNSITPLHTRSLMTAETLRFLPADDCRMQFEDSDYAGDVSTRNPASGKNFKFSGGAISWASKHQKCVSLSTIKVKFVSISQASKEAVWLYRLCIDIHQ